MILCVKLVKGILEFMFYIGEGGGGQWGWMISRCLLIYCCQNNGCFEDERLLKVFLVEYVILVKVCFF